MRSVVTLSLCPRPSLDLILCGAIPTAVFGMFSKSPSLLGIALLFLQMQSFVVARTCYAPDGTTAESRFMPCLGFDGVESMCCGTNSSKPDFCQPNGLCYYPRENTYWRNYCTDKTWSSPNCLPKDLCDSEVSSLQASTLSSSLFGEGGLPNSLLALDWCHTMIDVMG